MLKAGDTVPTIVYNIRVSTEKYKQQYDMANRRVHSYPYHLPPIRIVDLARWGIIGSVMLKTSMAR